MYFFLFLLCCNASAFVICVIKKYLLTYLLTISTAKQHVTKELWNMAGCQNRQKPNRAGRQRQTHSDEHHQI